jgi:hypothetical protein
MPRMIVSFSSCFRSRNRAPSLIVMMTSGRGSCQPCSTKSRSRCTFWNTPFPHAPLPLGSALGTMRYFAMRRRVENIRVPDVGRMAPERLCCTKSSARIFSDSVGRPSPTFSDIASFMTAPATNEPERANASAAGLSISRASASGWQPPPSIPAQPASAHAARTSCMSVSTDDGGAHVARACCPSSVPVIGITLLFAAGRRLSFFSRDGRSLADSIAALPVLDLG